MVQLLRDEDSTDKHLEAAWRHMRLCNLVRAAHPFAEAMQPFYDGLASAKSATLNARREEQARRDHVRLLGFEGADLLRTLSGDAQKHDRENPGARTYEAIFVEGGYSHLLGSDETASPEKLEEVALRVGSFGSEHALAPHAAALEAKAVEIRKAETNLAEAVRARTRAEGEEELAQAALRRQYEHNYLDARKLLGAACERLFPKLSRSRKKKTE